MSFRPSLTSKQMETRRMLRRQTLAEQIREILRQEMRRKGKAQVGRVGGVVVR